MKSFALKAIFAVTLLLAATVCHAQKWLTYDEHVEGRFPSFPANTNLAVTTTNNAGHAWRLVETNRIRVPQNSVLVVSGRHRTLTTLASNIVYGFSGSQNAVYWTSNAISAAVTTTGYLTNTFTVSVGTNLPYRYIVWDRTANQDGSVAATNDFLFYTFYPYRQSP